ncbi:unnamed protein product [marine sediment metagenome]|uniref:Uncharacterized protein n=1 Tax=marine sediment metagenome TaxID=412755 RepID=X1M2R0_9ZZZZ
MKKDYYCKKCKKLVKVRNCYVSGHINCKICNSHEVEYLNRKQRKLIRLRDNLK